MKPTWKHGVLIGVLLGWFAISLTLINDYETLLSKTVFKPVAIVNAKPKPIELPFGGTELTDKLFIALYGSPLYRGLGSLGEQNLDDSAARIKKLSATYAKHTKNIIIPTFEIITTVAAAEPTDNNDYSRETTIDKLLPMIDRAEQDGIYVVLDLQPGRSTFLSQAKLYETLLLKPHVGLALDPEWRLQTDKDRHLVKVGSVSATEVNETADWLAGLVRDNGLPQKIFLVHQFKPSMVTNREKLIANQEELVYIIHVDGFGTIGAKKETWNRIVVENTLPSGAKTGWKNFFDEDIPMPTPEQTMQQKPSPTFISYQ